MSNEFTEIATNPIKNIGHAIRHRNRRQSWQTFKSTTNTLNAQNAPNEQKKSHNHYIPHEPLKCKRNVINAMTLPFRNAYVSVSGEKRCIVLFRFGLQLNYVSFVFQRRVRSVVIMRICLFIWCVCAFNVFVVDLHVCQEWRRFRCRIACPMFFIGFAVVSVNSFDAGAILPLSLGQGLSK